MARDADGFPTVPFADVYLVTEELNRATHAEVDELERTLGCRMPHGYREYVTTLGEGTYCDMLRVYLPARILAEGDPFGPLVRFADSAYADVFGFRREAPNHVVCRTGRGSYIRVVDAAVIRLADVGWLAFEGRQRFAPRFRTFESWTRSQVLEVYATTPQLPTSRLTRFLSRRFASSERHLVNQAGEQSQTSTVYIKAVGGYAYVVSTPGPRPLVTRVDFIDRSPTAAATADLSRYLEQHGMGRP